MTDVRATAIATPVDLAADPRLRSSVERLLRDDYAVDKVIASTVVDSWPGDLAGRLLLSLARYARAGAPTLERATALNEALLTALEPQGYLGQPLGGVVDEQQVACHGWVVAGLLQHFYVTGDDRSRAAALRVMDALLVPALGHLDSYPWVRDTSVDVGGPSGTATQVLGGWLLSSDTGCVLLALNGLVPAFLETGRDDLRDLIRQLPTKLAALDLVGQRVQLHASLAAARCLADYAEATGDDDARRVAASVYDTYAQSGRTLNYATWNWFGRPDTWTEPCAIVDSLGLASTLARLTGEDRYRADAVHIAYWGLNFAHRRDGSFGLDSVATPEAPVLRPITWDAHWCCTMRGAIGLLEARETGVWPAADVPHLGPLPEIAGSFGPDDEPYVDLSCP